MESSKTDSSGPPMDMDVDESNEEPRSEPTPEVEGLKPEKENESNEKSPCESTATKEEVDSNEKLHSEPKVEESQKAEKEDESERNEKPPCEPSVAGFKPEEVDEDEGLADEFPVFSGKKRSARAKKLSSRKKMKIEIKIQTKMDEVEALFDEKYYGTTPFQSEIVPEDMAGTITQLEIDELNEKQVEEMLQFYEQTHEEQLPEVIAFNNQKHRLQCNKELEKLAKEDEQGRKEIAVIINEQLKEKQSSADRNIERLRNKAASEEQKDMQKLLQLYNEKAASNQNKIQNGIKLLTKRHQQEMQKQANQHHQVAQSQRMPEPMANAVWSRESQRLQVKYQRQLQEFNAKGEDVKKKCESDYAREREKRRKHHAKRKQDMEHGMQKVISRMHQNFHQQHQRYVKRHMQRLKKRRDEIVARMNGEAFPKRENKSKSQKDFLATDKENRVKLRAPSPIKSMVVEGQDPSDSNKAAAARHKHRKAILSTIPKQLAVEIHNEGLWISMIVPESKDDGKSRHDDKEKRKDDKSKDSEFIPWGLEARRVLHTVVCGEIPLGYDHNRFDFGDILTQQGGHIRCVVTDLRTGVDTASLQRAESIKEQEEDTVRELEKKANTFQQLMNEADKALNRAEGAEKDAIQACEKTQKDLEKAKKLLHDFKQKFGRFFGPDGRPIPNSASEKDQRRLLDASRRYSSNLVAAEEREKAARQALANAKSNTQKCHNQIKQTQKSSAAATTLLRKRKALTQDQKKGGRQSKQSESIDTERASVRVADVISSFKRTAEKRRGQLTAKRSSSASSTWVQGLPDIPGALKKSLWHKMHRRRRQQVVLRPSEDQVIDELKSIIRKQFQNAPTKGKDNKEAQSLERAEQLFLLAAHPASTNGKMLPITPSTTTNDPWGEPGWHLDLSVPKEAKPASRILPVIPQFPVFTKNLCEISSAPGRQAASILSASHLRALTSPLSAVAQAISLAETTPAISKTEVKYADTDPLNISDTMMNLGYKFVMKQGSKSSGQTKRKSSGKDEIEGSSKKDSAGDTPSSSSSSSRRPSVQNKNATSAANLGSALSQQQTARRTPSKGEKGRRRTSKAEPSPKVSKKISDPPVVAQVAPQQQAQPYMPHQQSPGAPMQMRNVYGQQQQVTQNPQNAQYAQQFMKPGPPPGQTVPPQMQQMQVQQQQMQQGMPPQQQLMPQARQQFPNQQAQFAQQQQMAQLRMMQQQAGARQAYPQSHPGHQMQFYNPAMAQRQQSFSAQQPLTMPVACGVPPPGVLGVPPRQPQRRNPQQAGDDQSDPLFMLNDM